MQKPYGVQAIHLKAHRGSMSHARRDEILTSYGLPSGDHPDFEIDHLIPLCLGGSDDPSNPISGLANSSMALAFRIAQCWGQYPIFKRV